MIRVAVILTACLLVASSAQAKVFLTREEALALAFPKCEIERSTHYLTDTQVARIEKQTGEKLRSALVHAYEARCQGKPGGTAYLDVHRVRTLAETLLVAVSPSGKIQRVEVLEFNEPEEYKASDRWYAQFKNRSLGPDLQLKKDIQSIAGATLTSQAGTSAIRRVLAIHEVLQAEKK